MANFIVTVVVIGILVFIIHAIDGSSFIAGTARKSNNTRVIAEPIFTGKTVTANLVLINDNEFKITKPTIKCDVIGKDGTSLKMISKVLEDTEIEAKSSIKLNQYNITIVNDFPSKMECHISAFVRG